MNGPRIDAHLHLWDRSRSSYAWLERRQGVLGGNFLAEQAFSELAAAGIAGAILVQADDTARESDFLLETAHEHDWIRGVVGWIPLDDPSAAEAQLAHRVSDPLFCGVRQLIHDDPRRDVLGLAPVRASLALIADAGLPFDVSDAWPRHLDAATRLAHDLPALTIVLDHLGKPPGGESAGYHAWSEGLARFAALENTVAKVSGLRLPGVEYTANALRHAWDRALELFGPGRLMYGGDWPITVPDGGYLPTFAVLDELIGELSASEQSQIMGETAVRVYGLKDAV